jgi:hypothetical protein
LFCMVTLKQKVLNFADNYGLETKVLCEGLSDVPDHFEMYVDGGEKYSDYTGIYFPYSDDEGKTGIKRHIIDTEKLTQDGKTIAGLVKQYNIMTGNSEIEKEEGPYKQLIKVREIVQSGDYLRMLLNLSKNGYLMKSEVDFD